MLKTVLLYCFSVKGIGNNIIKHYYGETEMKKIPKNCSNISASPHP